MLQNKEIKDFELIPANSESKEDGNKNMTIGDLKTRKFKMRVNQTTYDVYPDLRSLLYSPEHYTKRTGFEKLS